MDPSTLQPFFEWLSANPGWAALIVFLIALTESLIIVGLVVPGTMAMMGVGALIGAGVLPFWSMAAWAVAGAIAGDGISYWVGYRYRERLRGIWPLSKKPQLLDKGEVFFARHGGKSVLFGRFVGPLRPVIPAVAGMMEMPLGRFLLVNVVSALAWAPVTLLPGMVLGASLSLAAAVAGRLAVFVVLLLVLLWLVVLISQWLYRYLSPRALKIMTACLDWAKNHRYLGPVVAAALDPAYPTAKGLLLLGLILLPGVWAVLALFTTVAQPAPSALDVSLQHFFRDLKTPLMDQLLAYAHWWLQWPVMLMFGLSLMIALLIFRQFRMAQYFFAAALLVSLSALLANVMLQGDAAEFALYPGVNVAFMSSVLITGMLAAIVSIYLHPYLRVIPYLLFAGLAMFELVALLHFSQAWFSELLLALAMSLMWLMVLAIAMRRHMVKTKALPRLLGFALLMSLLLINWSGLPDREQVLQAVSPAVEQYRITHATWLDFAWQRLPAQRVDLRAAERQPLALQWLGSAAEIDAFLRQEGWRSPPALDGQSWLRWFAPDVDVEVLPLLPRIHDGHYEQFKYTRVYGERLLVMRFWQSHYLVDGEPLYLVSVTREAVLSPMMSVPRTVEASLDFSALLADWQGMVYRQKIDGRILLWRAGK